MNQPIPQHFEIEAWQLTAYALGELDQHDMHRVERALQSSESLRIEYEQIQQTIGAVRTVLAPVHSNLGLSAAQAAEVTKSIHAVAASSSELPVSQPSDHRPFYRRKRFAALLATAAAVPIALSCSPWWQNGWQGRQSDLATNLTRVESESPTATNFNEGVGRSLEELDTLNSNPVAEVRTTIADSSFESKNHASAASHAQLGKGKDGPVPPNSGPSGYGMQPGQAYGGAPLGYTVEKSRSPVAGGGKPQSAPNSLTYSRADSLIPANPEKPRPLPEELRQNVPQLFDRESPKGSESIGGDRFEQITEAPFIVTDQAPLSTFSIDVDTASYAKIRQYLTQTNALPQPNMVRIEEMVNYFSYEYAGPSDDSPFAAHMAVDRCPWNLQHQLVRIGLQARKVDIQKRPSANIVFLLDVSGSMDQPNKLPLVKKTLSLLTNQLNKDDRVAIVVYAGAAGCVLPSTCGAEKQTILDSLNHLNAGGSTNGGQGIQLAYSIAKENFIPGGINRVILCTDGDFNVGVTSDNALVEMMKENAKSNIFLTCLGYGMGNYNDSMMEKISNQGNGVYGMIDNEIEARRMMVEQLAGTLVTVAKDVKIQVDFNPNKVAGYRLIGYEDRRLANKDFDDDKKDAGEIGAGHRVTALYEVIPTGTPIQSMPSNDSETSKYAPKIKVESKPVANNSDEFTHEVLTLKVRYKEPEGSVSTKKEFVLRDNVERAEVDRDMQWASAVAEFGLLLRRSRLAPNADWGRLIERAESSTQGDAYRLECVELMRRAASLDPF